MSMTGFALSAVSAPPIGRVSGSLLLGVPLVVGSMVFVPAVANVARRRATPADVFALVYGAVLIGLGAAGVVGQVLGDRAPP
jgi:hypothetical protein